MQTRESDDVITEQIAVSEYELHGIESKSSHCVNDEFQISKDQQQFLQIPIVDSHLGPLECKAISEWQDVDTLTCSKDDTQSSLNQDFSSVIANKSQIDNSDEKAKKNSSVLCK